MNTIKRTISAVLALSFSALWLLPGCQGPAPGDDVEGDIDIEGEELLDEEQVGEAASELVAWCDSTLNWNADWAAFESKVITLVNQKRAAGATCGGVAKPPVPALTMGSALRCAARKHSKDMSTKNFVSHTGSNGSTASQRMISAGYLGTPWGENIAGGQTTPAAVVTSWMNSTGHCNGIMNGQNTRIGVGYSYRAGADYKHYWTLDFGRP